MLAPLRKNLANSTRRILDHRVFVNGEINEFLKNFELKRNDSEVEGLFRATEAIGELRYELVDRCIHLSDKNLEALANEVKTLLAGVDKFTEKSHTVKDPSEFLFERRKAREQKKLLFDQDLEHCYQRLDNSFEQKEEEIVELYTDLQFKLNIPKSNT